ncbi:hypothetical protein COCCADRAFT_87290, partial [Bipolaris zeicola 26-R-13]
SKCVSSAAKAYTPLFTLLNCQLNLSPINRFALHDEKYPVTVRRVSYSKHVP